MAIARKIATNTTTKIYDMCGNSVDADAIFMMQMQSTLEHVMDVTGYTEKQILNMSNDLIESDDFRNNCVEYRRASFRVVK